MGNTENFKKKENLNENVPQWVTESIRAGLFKLRGESDLTSKVSEDLDAVGARSFYYTLNGDDVEYNIDNVKAYLNVIKNKEWSDLKELSGAWILAVQIALESLNNPRYDVGKIDGIYGKDTRKAVENFQSDNNLTVDGAPGKETIGVLFDCLNGNKGGNAGQQTAATGQTEVAGQQTAATGQREVAGQQTAATGQTEVAGQQTAATGQREVAGQQMAATGQTEVSKKSQEFTSENITNDEMQSYVDSIKRQCMDSLKIRDGEVIDVSFEGKNLKFGLGGTGETYANGFSGNNQLILYEMVDVKTCLKGGNPTDPEYGNVDIEYVKNSVIKGVKEKLINQKKAVMGWRALVSYYKSNGLTKDDVFKGVSLNDRQNGRVNTFFGEFDDKKLVLDCQDDINSSATKYEGDSIKLEFDDSWFNEDYNQWENNSDLIIKASEIVRDDYVLDVSKFKEKLRGIILKIIEREDFKG